jgi:hypothetical protein
MVMPSSETSILMTDTWRNIQEGCILHNHHRGNLKSYKLLTLPGIIRPVVYMYSTPSVLNANNLWHLFWFHTESSALILNHFIVKVGFEVIRALGMIVAIFWDTTPCTPQVLITCCTMLSCSGDTRHWKWRWYVFPRNVGSLMDYTTFLRNVGSLMDYTALQIKDGNIHFVATFMFIFHQIQVHGLNLIIYVIKELYSKYRKDEIIFFLQIYKQFTPQMNYYWGRHSLVLGILLLIKPDER